MDSSRKTTPVSQRGIGAFLTGLNAAKYSDSKLPSRGRPPKKQKVHFETITEDGPSTADDEEVGIQSAMLQPQLMAADNEVTPLPLSRNVTLKQKIREDENSDGEQSSSGDGSSSDEGDDSAATTSMPQLLLKKRRPQTQRVRKGHSDGAWRQKQLENPNRWQLAWMAIFQWAERVPAMRARGRCTTEHAASRAHGCSPKRWAVYENVPCGRGGVRMGAALLSLWLVC